MTGSPEERLRQAVNEILVFSLEDCKPSERTWREHANRLREKVLEEDPRRFLEFWIVRHTMYTVGHDDWADAYLGYLKALPDWKFRWFEAIRVSPVGKPLLFKLHTDKTTLCHAYILAQFETRTGIEVNDLSAIFEFGGGYGSMARLVHNLGFTGRYLDYDLPVLTALAGYYLNLTGLHQTSFFSNVDELEKTLTEIDTDNSLFLSTWGLSETPLKLRETILELVHDFRYFLLTYQSEFYEMKNCRFFADWMAQIDKVKWQTWAFENVGSYGLVGVRQDD